MTSTDTDRLAEARARIDAAGDHLGEICTSKKQFRMSIPADPSKDSDLILGAALESAEDLLSLVEQLQSENEALRAAPEIVKNPAKAGHIASLVRSSTRLVRIERDDARAQVEQLQGQLDKALEARSRLEIQLEDGELSDGYHTHNELYEYRLLYNAHAARGWLAAGCPVSRSKRHDDGEECFGGGWFVVAATLPTGQVSNHYRLDDWGLFDGIPELPTAPMWDGHTPAEAAERLRAALGLGEEADDA